MWILDPRSYDPIRISMIGRGSPNHFIKYGRERERIKISQNVKSRSSSMIYPTLIPTNPTRQIPTNPMAQVAQIEQ